MENLSVGVLGGGQLGRMLAEAAHRLNIPIIILDAPNVPAKQVIGHQLHVDGSFKKAQDVRALFVKCDIITAEIEHVDVDVLAELDEESPVASGTLHHSRVQPSWRTIKIIQNKFNQKIHLSQYDIPTAESILLSSHSSYELKKIASTLGFPLMLKSCTEAYDGRGNYPVRSLSDIPSALSALADRPLYAEKWENFRLELAVMVVKTSPESILPALSTSRSSSAVSWEEVTQAYPPVETVHEDSICKLVYAPARNVSEKTLSDARELARRAVATFEGCGVFGVELFLLEDDRLVLNEIAPRPHNSGHYTIEACHMSQYEAHLRAILPNKSIPPGATKMRTTAAIMLNILGGSTPDAHLLVAKAAEGIPGAVIHLYGKGNGRPGRKMGHITLTSMSSMEDAEHAIKPLMDWVEAVRTHKGDTGDPAHINELIKATAMEREGSWNTPPVRKPLVGVTMGSDSDLHVLKPGLVILDQLQVPYEVTITSAHRTPDRMINYAKTAVSRGLKCIIAAAGGAAHLPGMLASSTSLVVFGIPVLSSTGATSGMDALLSIAQMPRGVPVSTMAINGGVNAALSAARLVGAFDSGVQDRVDRYMEDMRVEIDGKAQSLEEKGWSNY